MLCATSAVLALVMSTTATLERVQSSKRLYHRALLAQKLSTGHSSWHLAPCHPVPSVGPGQVLVKSTHVALNPFDWQGVVYGFGVDAEAKVMGRDGAGVVVGVGSGVSRFRTGDRVWFCADSSRAGTGAFQEFSVHSQFNIAHTPPNLTDEQAATLGSGLVTAGVALFRTLRLDIESFSPEPSSCNGQWILIAGGAGITGVYLIQLAHHLGYRVICAASPVNFEYLRQLGAEAVVDRWAGQEDIVRQIRKVTNDEVRLAVDNVGPDTAEMCWMVLQGSRKWRETHGVTQAEDTTGTGRIVPLAGFNSTVPSFDAVRSVEKLRISFSTTFYAEQHFAQNLLDHYTRLLVDGRLVPARFALVKGGLGGIERGLDDLRHGRVQGGYKLVARVAETPWADEAEEDTAVTALALRAQSLSLDR